MDILFVCTGNICRSPMAEGLLRARLEAAGEAAHVHSAGLLFDGEPAEPYAVDALKRLGVDIRDHRARTISRELLEGADVVLTMEHRHVREVVLSDGGELARTFTLPDFVARAEALAEERGPRTEPFAAWVATIAAARPSESVIRGDPSVEVKDPMGDSKRVFRRTAAELQGLVDRLAAVGWPTEAAVVAHRAQAAPPDPAATQPVAPTLETRSS